MESAAPCKFFQTTRGCLRGDSCTFRHEKPETNGVTHHHHGGGSGGASSSPSQYPPGGGVVDLADSITSYSPGNPYASGMPPGASSPCRFFLSEAGCRNGGSCPFAHVNMNAPYGGGPPPPMAFGGDPGAIMYGMPPPPPLPLPLPMQMFDGSMGMPPMMPSHNSTSNNNASPLASSMDDGANGATNGNPTTPGGKPRRKLNIQANPSKKANYEVISEIMPVITRDIEGPFFAIDVECVATGPGVDDRDVARIAIVNEGEEVSYDQHVLPDKPIVSYLTQLTGISESNLVGAPSFADALTELRHILPSDSVIVGQSIKKDLEWLGLVKGEDYKQAFDVADLFRIPMQSKNGTIRYRFFSLRHVAKYLLGHDIQEADHDPVIDAKYAMKIFKQFRHLHESPGRRDAVYQTLLQTPRTPSFAERYPVIDGVLMRAPRKPRENHHHQQHGHHHQSHGEGQGHGQPGFADSQHHQQYHDHDHGTHHHQQHQYNANAVPPPASYAPDPALMT